MSAGRRRLSTAVDDPRQPLAVLDLEIGGGLRDLNVGDYRGADLLVRLRGRPIGRLVLATPDGVLPAEELERALDDPDLSNRLAVALVRRFLGGEDRMPEPGAPLTVAICTRDRPKALERCLASLGTVEDGEILVVDNDPSDDASQQVAKRSGARYLREERRGLNAARRAALANARHDLVAFVDDDVVVDPGWRAAIVGPFAQPRVGAVTGLTLPLELETPAQRLFEWYGGHGRGFERRVFESSHFPAAAAGRAGSGANMAFRRDLARRLDLFGADIDAGTATPSGGDTLAFYRVLRSGWRIVYTPDALVRHEHRRDEAAMRRLVRGYEAGTFGLLLRHAVQERDGQTLRVGLEYLRKHHLRQLARALRRKPRALPLGMLLSELAGIAEAPLVYWRARRTMGGATRQTP